MTKRTQILAVENLGVLGKYTFKKPLDIEIYKETDEGINYFFAESDYLSSVGVGETIKEAMESLEEHIDAFVYGFGHFPEDKVSNSSKRYIKRFEEYIDLKKMYNLLKETW
jgi:predicted RNase H-like HicB family nuclease